MVLVQRTSKMKVLIFAPAPEQSFCGLIETFGNMVQHGGSAVLGRSFEFIFQKPPCSATDENGAREKT